MEAALATFDPVELGGTNCSTYAGVGPATIATREGVGAMTSWQRSDLEGLVEIAEPPDGMIQIQLEEVGRHSWKSALFGAVMSAGGGPLYRFVAAAPGGDHDEVEHAGSSVRFPLVPFQDLDEEADDKWTALARKRLAELDAELVRIGWHRRPDRGRHWWSLRYEW